MGGGGRGEEEEWEVGVGGRREGGSKKGGEGENKSKLPLHDSCSAPPLCRGHASLSESPLHTAALPWLPGGGGCPSPTHSHLHLLKFRYEH